MKFLTFKWHGNELVRNWYSYSALKRFTWHHGGLGPFNYYSKMIEIGVIETAHLKWIRLVSHREKWNGTSTYSISCSVLLFCFFAFSIFLGQLHLVPLSPPPLSPLPSTTHLWTFFYRAEYLTNITEIETEGVEDETNNLWVESYYVSTSNSTEGNSFVNYTEDGKTKIVSRWLL